MPRRNLASIAFLALILALGAPASAEAQRRGKGKRAVRAEAKALFEEGQKHYTLGEFADALKDFSAAYDKLPLPAFLFNIAQCHKEMKNHERALFFFEGYLRDAPDAGNREVVEELIAETRSRLEDQKAAEAEAERLEAEKAALAEKRAEAERIRKADAEKRAAELAELRRIAEEMKAAKEQEAFRPPPVVEEPKGPPITKRWWFWTALGALAIGAAGGGAAVALRPTELPTGSLGTIDHR